MTGLDWAAAAIERATARAAAAGVSATFAVADATRLDGYDGAFDTVLDSALYHCLSPDERHAYLAALTRATRPGARLHLLCFSTDMPAQSVPERFLVSEASLRETVGPGWTIERLDPVGYTSATTPEEFVIGIRVIQGGNLGPQFSVADFSTDAEGRVLLPMWQLAAVRAG